MSYNVLLEEMVGDLGGCGRFQWITAFIVQTSKALACWSMLAMTFNGQQPNFMCKAMERGNNSANSSGFDNVCNAVNTSDDCNAYVYSNSMNTIVNEWDLVCDSKWIVAMVTTIQMAGVLVGCFISGHLGDLIGRKPTFFASLIILVLFNIVAYYSISWQMYAAVRFIIGMGIGFFLTVQYNVMTEFVTTKWRAVIIAIPAWAMEAGVFALAAWGLKDWKNLHLVTAAIGLPFILAICIIQESTRWLLTKGRYDDAQFVIKRVAKMNGKPAPDTNKVIAEAKVNNSKNEAKTKYSVIDLFRTREMVKMTLGLLFIWMAISYSYYALTFGIQSLSGDLYMNMFLMNVIECPASFTIMYLVNRFGRKYCCVAFFMFNGLCGIVVGVIQYVDIPNAGIVTNVFALASKVGIACGWGCLVVYTTELYPTVVRTIAYGLHNTSARIGGMIAPQIVLLNDAVPGLMYFLSAVVMITSSLLCLLFPDTKGKILEDALPTTSNTDEAVQEVEIAKSIYDDNTTKMTKSSDNNDTSKTEPSTNGDLFVVKF